MFLCPVLIGVANSEKSHNLHVKGSHVLPILLSIMLAFVISLSSLLMKTTGKANYASIPFVLNGGAVYSLYLLVVFFIYEFKYEGYSFTNIYQLAMCSLLSTLAFVLMNEAISKWKAGPALSIQ